MKQTPEHVAARVAGRKAKGRWFRDLTVGKKISAAQKRRFAGMTEEQLEQARKNARRAGRTRCKPKPVLFCQHCGKLLVKLQKMFCSKACKNKAQPCDQKHKRRGLIVSCPSCGKESYKKRNELKEQNYCSVSCFAKTRIKERNTNWRGGIFPESQLHYGKRGHKEWSHQVMKRDNFTCQLCGIRGIKFHAHHVKPRHLFPELAFDVNNGMTVCISCHNKTHHAKNYGYPATTDLSKGR